ncbi:MAG: geopeptide radical SAM maturase [Thermodesulfovibrionales bacterium]|jgi:uncharacterized protein
MFLSQYAKVFSLPEDADSRIAFSTKRASIIQIPKSVIEEIERGDIPEKEERTLRKLGFLVTSIEYEKNRMRNLLRKLDAHNRVFNATVVMNLDCNLACTYCFEGKRKGAFYMSRETADSFYQFVKKKIARGINGDPFEEIDIRFYGGEPLLSKELILYLSRKLKKLAQKNSVSYSSSFVTNGTLLTSETVEQLKPLGLKSAIVTLDGPQGIHDQSRPFKSGKGSYDAIFKNVRQVRDLMEVHIGGNFTRRNYAEFPTLLDHMMQNGLTPEKIANVSFSPVFRESSEFRLPHCRDGCASLDERWIAKAGIFLREEILKRGYRTQRIMPSACTMQQTENLIVNHDGSLYKCPGLIGRKGFCIGDLKTEIKDYRQTHNLDSYKNKECLDCSYLPLCFGGCRYMKIIRDGTMEGVHCLKSRFDATLQDFVLQDIKYNITRQA